MNSQDTFQSPPEREAAGIRFIAVESFRKQLDEFSEVIAARDYEIYENRAAVSGDYQRRNGQI